MSAKTLVIVLQLAGVAVIIAEIILPSGGLLSVMAMGLFGYSLYLVFAEVSTSMGMTLVIADIILIPVLVIVGLKLLARSPVTLHTQLSKENGVSSQAPELENYLGKEGKALTDLHPAGTALIDGKRLDVVSRGEYVERDSALLVIAVTGNQIIVREK